MKFFFSIILLATVPQTIFAKATPSPVVRAISSDRIDFKVYLKQQVQKVSYVHFFETQRVESKLNQKLLETMEKAQSAYLSANFSLAKKLFKEIASLRWSHDWPADERKLIHYALLRLSQIDTKLSKSWLVAAVDFDSKLKPDHNLFPPPFVTDYKTTSLKRTKVIWSPPFKHSEYKWLFINGRRVAVESASPIELPVGKTRLHFLSNSLKPYLLVSKPSELFTQEMPSEPFAIGNCKNPTIATQQNLSVFFQTDCIHESSNGRATPQAQDTKAFPAEFRSGLVQDIANTAQLETQLKQPTKWYKNQWIWLAAGAATIYMVNKDNQGSRKQPTHTVTKH